MKLIRKMRLINWHFFEDQTFDLRGINVISGQNGSGKSTILDAMNYFFSGGTCKFNTAANSLSSGRTVETYLKAKIGVLGKEYLRDTNDVIGHIAIEFYDDTKKQPLVIGLVIQLSSSRLNGPYYYQILNAKMNDKLFFSEDDRVVNGFDELISSGKKQGMDIRPLGQKSTSNKKRKQSIEDALGIQDKYVALFGKALSFEPLQDISRFAMDFLLPEAELDLVSIQDAIYSYRAIQAQVESEEKRREELQPIVDNKTKYETLQKRLFGFDLLILRGQNQASDEAIKRNTRKIGEEEQKRNEFSAEAQLCRARATEARTSAEKIRESDQYKLLKQKDDALRVAKERKSSAQAGVQKFEASLKSEMAQALHIGTSLSLNRVINDRDYVSYREIIANYVERVRQIQRESSATRGVLEQSRKELAERRASISREIQQLESNINPLPNEVQDLIDKVKQEILNRKGDADAYVKPLFHFLEVNDVTWHDAIEGLLDNRRFDLFVSSKYRDIAKVVFDAGAKSKDYSKAGIIDKEDKTSTSAPLKDSLSKKINTLRTNPDGSVSELREPRAYIDFLLGQIRCVNSPEDFNPGEKAITKSGVYFDGKSSRFVSKAAIEIPYIGSGAIEKRLNNDRLWKEELDGKIASIEKSIREKERVESEASRSNGNYLLRDEINYWRNYQIATKEVEEIESDIEKIKKSGNGLSELSEAILSYESEALRAAAAAEKAEKNSQDCAVKIGSLRQCVEQEKENIETNSEKYQKKIDESDFAIDNLDTFLSSLADGRYGEELKNYAILAKGPTQESLNSVSRIIQNAISDYCSQHPNELKPDINNYMAFVQRYNKIINDELAKLKPDLEEALKKSEHELYSGFISKIRSSLQNAKKDIAMLNRSLRSHPFGNGEIYEFEAKPSTDALLSKIYHIAMETNEDTVINLLTVNSPETDQVVKEVLELLARPEDDPNYRERREEILDYRRYWNYDVSITLPNKEKMSYGENRDSKSGGETQTPFYALIAGAFQSIVSTPERLGNSPICAVAFDEAFNNMDGERISQMLDFYSALKIQLFISVPSSRFSYIAPYAEEVISLAKGGDNTVFVYTNTKAIE